MHATPASNCLAIAPTDRRAKPAFAALAGVAFTVALTAGATHAADGFWAVNKDGSWATTTNWVGGVVPQGLGARATFDLDITANRTISVSGTRTVGHLVFRDTALASHPFLLLPSSGTLILDNGADKPTISVYPGSSNLPVAQIGGQITTANGFQVLAPAGPATLAIPYWGTTLAGAVVVGSGADSAILRVDSDTSLGRADPLTAATDSSLLAMAHFTEIRNGSTLDLNGDRNLGPEFIRVAGNGVNNAGAIINTVYTGVTTTLHAFQQVQLTGDTTFGGSARWDIRSDTAATGRLFQDGHALRKTGSNQVSLNNVTVVGGGEVEVNQGTFSIEDGTVIGGSGTIHINAGGTLMFYNNTGAVTRDIHLNGGLLLDQNGSVLSTVASNITLDAPINEIQKNGFNSYAQLELTGAISGADKRLMSTGTATLILSNPGNTFSGEIQIVRGKLGLGTTGQLTANNSVSINPGAVFMPGTLGHVIGTGKTLLVRHSTYDYSDIVGNITLQPGAILEVGPLLSNFPTTTTGTATIEGNLTVNSAVVRFDIRSATAFDNVTVTGNLILSGISQIHLSPNLGILPEGTYPLMSCSGTLTGNAANIQLAGLPTGRRQSFAIGVNNSAKTVTLNITNPAGALVWKGDEIANVWSRAAVGNWTNTGSGQPDVFMNLDTVSFTDTGSNSPAIELQGTLEPGTLTVDSAKDYTFGGTGVLSGCAVFTKRNSGTLTISSSAHDFWGGVNVAGGTVTVPAINKAGVAGSLGVNGTINFDGGTLKVTGDTVSDRNLVAGAGGGTLVVANGATFTHTGSAPTGTVLTRVENGGTLVVGDGGPDGSLGSGRIDTNASGKVAWFRTSGYVTGFAVANPLTGSGTAEFKGADNGSDYHYSLSADNSPFGGQFVLERARLDASQATRLGSGRVDVGDGATLSVGTGTYGNAIAIAGQGWNGPSGPEGALQFSAGSGIVTLGGTLTLTAEAAIGMVGAASSYSCTLAGSIGESGGPHLLELIQVGTYPNARITLQNTSTRSGPTFVSGVRATLFANSALGSGEITVRSAAATSYVSSLDLLGVALPNKVILASTASTGNRSALNATGNKSSPVNGEVLVTAAVADGGHFGADGGSLSVLRLNGPIRIAAGSGIVPRIQMGVVELGDTSGLGNLTALVQGSGAVRLVATNGMQPGIEFRMAGSGAGVFDLNGFHQSLGQLKRLATAAATVTNGAGPPSVLTINATADHEFSGGIQDGTGGISLVKGGSHTVTLTGANTYSGATTVTAGILAGTGSASSDLLVKAGATLAPGAGLGTFICKAAAFESGATLRYEINSRGTGSDLLRANGDVNLSGTVALELADTAATPATFAAGTKLVVIEYTGHSLNGTFAGVPDGSVVSVALSQFVINYRDPSSGTDAGQYVTLTATGTASPYNTWALANITARNAGAPAGFAMDADGDTHPNGLEWLLGGDPLAQDAATLVGFTTTDLGDLSLDFHRRGDVIGATSLSVQWSSDLNAEWAEIPIGASSTVGENGIAVTVDDASSPQRINVRLPRAISPGGKLFARLRAVSR
jgi:fibronectin-binding autotransporter adhesin